MISLSTLLKEKTKASHQELEKKIITKLKAVRKIEDYIALLACFYKFIAPLERKINLLVTDHILPDIKTRRKASLLNDDLNDLYEITDLRPETLPARIPPIEHVPAALGALYVLEGSTLGGAIIVKILNERANLYSGMRFFNGYGDETEMRWQFFKARLDQSIQTDEEKNAVILTANDVFNYFSKLFN